MVQIKYAYINLGIQRSHLQADLKEAFFCVKLTSVQWLGYGLVDQGTVVRFSRGAILSSSPKRPYRLRGASTSYSNDASEPFPESKAMATRTLPLTCTRCWQVKKREAVSDGVHRANFTVTPSRSNPYTRSQTTKQALVMLTVFCKQVAMQYKCQLHKLRLWTNTYLH